MTTSTYDYANEYPNLSDKSDRLQEISAGYLWHRSHPNCYLVVGEKATGEFITMEGVGTGEYYRNANLFTMTEPTFGKDFWLVPDSGGRFDKDLWESAKPTNDRAVWVPWRHIVQHLRASFMFEDKEVNTFWPASTTEATLLDHLVDALNNDSYTGACGGATIYWESDNKIKTFFLNKAASPADRYTSNELSDIKDMFGV